MTSDGHTESMEEKRNAYKIFVGKHEEIVHLADQGRDGRIVLKWILMI
jgi:hypothetical protein